MHSLKRGCYRILQMFITSRLAQLLHRNMSLLCPRATRSVHSKKTHNNSIFSVILILVIMICSLCLYVDINPINDYFAVTNFLENSNFNGPCVLPEVNPFDPIMTKKQMKFKPIECKRCEPLVYIDEMNRIVFNKTYIMEKSVSRKDVSCECNNILRTDADQKIKWDKRYTCQPPFSVKSDFFKVVCTYNGNILYDNIVTAIFRNNSKSGPLKGYYNVYMIGIDSMSRSVAMRQLKKTLQYVDKELKAFTFKGYVKVGSNTFPNIIPMLTGRQAYTKELPDLKYFDTYPLIWKNFSRAKYKTLYAEDFPVLNAFNIAGRRGFVNIPTDHYMRPFWLAWNAEYPMRDYNMGLGFKLLKSDFFKSKTEQYTLCAGNAPNFIVHLNYLRQFIHTYKQNRKFVFSFNTELGHYSENFLNLADEELLAFIKWLNLKDTNDSILILFGDHGQKVSENYQKVRLEQNLPMLSIILPQQLLKVYPRLARNMRENTDRLTTHYDLYTTLLDIAGKKFDSPSKFVVDGQIRGRSLFGEISSERSCADAAIPEHLCICHQSRKVADKDLGQKLAEAAVRELNSLVSIDKKCAHLTLKSVIDVQEVINSRTESSKRSKYVIRSKIYVDDIKKYTVIIRTDPGAGEFLATCKLRSKGNIEVLKDIDRINIYGNQSHCVTESNLKPLCYCID